MGLILCKTEKVKHPFLVEALDIHIYSLEELCYIIYEYPMLVLDGFVNNRLKAFIVDELDLGALVHRFESINYDSNNDVSFLYTLLEYSDYYSNSEINKYKARVSLILRLPHHEYLKQKADLFFYLHKYGKAIRYYKASLSIAFDNKIDSKFKANVYYNLASSYANQFFTEDAYDSYSESYNLVKDLNTLKQIYFLSKIDSDIILSDKFKSIITKEMENNWLGEFNKIKSSSILDDRVNKLNMLFDNDAVKKKKYISNEINIWKQNYRNML